MKNNTKLQYRGDITISIGKNKKFEHHNAGETPLFEFLARAICGQFTTETTLLPTHIDIVNHNTTTSCLYNKVSVVKQVVTENEIPKAALRCVIPKTNIKTSPQSVDIILTTEEPNGVVFARSSIDSGVVGISDGQQAVIEWRLYVQNTAQE